MGGQNGKLFFADGLSERIRFARKQANLSVDALASGLGVSPSAVRNWECGHKFPSRENMDMLTTLMGPDVDTVWLQTGVRHQPDSHGGQAVTPQRFYLICERREDGGLRITCPEVPGLVLSSSDPHAVMRDVIPAIDAIERHSLKKPRHGGRTKPPVSRHEPPSSG